MKKLLLSALACLSLGPVFAAVDTFVPANLPKANLTDMLQAEATAPDADFSPAREEAAQSYDIRFAGDVYTWAYLNKAKGITNEGFIYVPAQMATRLAGNKVTKLGTVLILNTASTKEGTIFVRESFYGENVTSSTVTFQTSTTSDRTGFEYEFEQPYEIKAGQGFYFGFSIPNCNNLLKIDYTIPIDQSEGGEFSGIAGYIPTTGSPYYVSLEGSGNLVCWAVTEGDVTELLNFGYITGFQAGSSACPIYKPTQTAAKMRLPVLNMGENVITSIDYEVGVNGVKTTGRYTGSIACKATTTALLTAPELPVGHNEITLTITGINDQPQNIELAPRAVIRNPAEGCLTRRMVVEEATGTWCGWCPRGIVGMDWASENLTDFIGIAVHGGDDLSVDSYDPFFNLTSSFPSCLINRDYQNSKDPTSAVLKTANSTFLKESIGSIEVEAVYDPEANVIQATSTTTFAVDVPQSPYRVAYVVLEDGLVDIQTNYYSPDYGQGLTLAGWDDAEPTVETTYKHTARDIFSFYGLENSLPAAITAGQPMTNTHTLSLENVEDPSKTSVVALLVETTTNTILTGAKVDFEQYAAVDAPMVEQGVVAVRPTKGGIAISGNYSTAAVYDAAGRRVAALNGSNAAALPAGIYVVVVDGVASKVAVR